jgi:hypothetical protein
MLNVVWITVMMVVWLCKHDTRHHKGVDKTREVSECSKRTISLKPGRETRYSECTILLFLLDSKGIRLHNKKFISWAQ